jgi:hypothetical protein
MGSTFATPSTVVSGRRGFRQPRFTSDQATPTSSSAPDRIIATASMTTRSVATARSRRASTGRGQGSGARLRGSRGRAVTADGRPRATDMAHAARARPQHSPPDARARSPFRDVSLIQRIPEGGVISSIRAVSGENEDGELRAGPMDCAAARRSRAERRSQAWWAGWRSPAQHARGIATP